MGTRIHYETVTEALRQLKERGYTKDFNLQSNCIVCNGEKYNPEDFEIVEVFRYEGNSDPADEATVYAIESGSGMKGVLVAGYGPSIEPAAAETIKRLQTRKIDLD